MRVARHVGTLENMFTVNSDYGGACSLARRRVEAQAAPGGCGSPGWGAGSGAASTLGACGSARVVGVLAAAAVLSVAGQDAVRAAGIDVPNGSFESPTTSFVDTRVSSWQKTAQPAWYDPAAFGYTWDQTSGVFANTAPGAANHIDNCDGQQALFLLAIPEVGLFQDYTSTDWSGTTPSHAFDAVFEVGMSYTLTVGITGGGGMVDGAGLRLSLYYRDGLDNPVTVGATDVQYSMASFPNTTHLNDYEVVVPAVKAGDAWAGQHIGIQIVATSLGNSYWDLDHVRLTQVPEPSSFALLAFALGGSLLARRRSQPRA